MRIAFSRFQERQRSIGLVDWKARDYIAPEQKRQKLLSYIFAGGGFGVGMDEGIDFEEFTGKIRLSRAVQLG
jgi:hypothetical protein